MRSTRAHAAVALVLVAMLALVFSLLMPPAAWRSLFARGRTHDAVAAAATPASSPTPGTSTELLRLVTCSFVIAADDDVLPAPPSSPDTPPALPSPPPLIAHPPVSPVPPVPVIPADPSIPIVEFKDDIQGNFILVRVVHIEPPLASDWNNDKAVTMDDLWAFMNSWFAGAGDANKDGQTSTDDLYTFLNNWFDGK